MTPFERIVTDLIWLRAVYRARRWRRHCSLAQRIAFDAALRPSMSDDRSVLITYPDALYFASGHDIDRAMKASGKPNGRWP